MEFALRDLATLAPVIWPLVLVTLWWMDRRLRAVERGQDAILANLNLLLAGHHLEENKPDGSVRLHTS